MVCRLYCGFSRRWTLTFTVRSLRPPGKPNPHVRRVTGSALPGGGVAPAAAGERRPSRRATKGALSQERRAHRRAGGTCRRPARSRAPTRVWAAVERADSRSRYVSCEPARARQGAKLGPPPARAVIYLFGGSCARRRCAPRRPGRRLPSEDFIPLRPACCGD
ncbi:unnamed protein product [Rangifer tarandus platyrhynchus]|uniref:Uncharacterized protein n=2 Tax=Rangifer tarandus platyrhynchus TaxID=3082113 RepID=A0ACB0E7A1_RANTA|nr:unnamed protein product [Rangifer tarandus platyrhynchus]CAI9696319.1 unnamed protein product [Rangifer tarandus platyrhynchus]